MPGANYKSIKPQNDLILHEHVIQGFHGIMGKSLLALVHPSTPISKNTVACDYRLQLVFSSKRHLRLNWL